MPDRLTRGERSAHMARIKGSGTLAEKAIHDAARRARLRFTKHAAMPGRPDLVLPRNRVAVFVHGCFWHGCPKHYRRPSTHLEYWDAKLAGNMRRDRRVARALRKEGWAVLTIWECDARADPDRAVARVARVALRRRARPSR